MENFWRLKEASLVMCCDMTHKSQYVGVREVLQKHVLLHSGLLKNISTVMNMHVAIENLLEAVCLTRVTKLHKESQRDLE
jgi:hypothetical protein